MVVKNFHLQTTKLQTKTLISMQTGHPFGNFYAAAEKLGLIFIPWGALEGWSVLEIKSFNSAIFVI